MKIIFIRHAEPDYEKDSLTEKGWREAACLSNRISSWEVTDFYVSPLGRAKDTASLSLEKLNRTATTLDWLHEFDCPVTHPETNKRSIPWDLFPEYWTSHEELLSVKDWHKNELMQTAPLKDHFAWTSSGLDELLAKYGYLREGGYYRVAKEARRDACLVCFCHLGITCASIAHLLNITPVQMWQGFFIPPSSVSVLGAEERKNGSAQFRCQVIGDTAHLLAAGEPVSHYGYFTDPFCG